MPSKFSNSRSPLSSSEMLISSKEPCRASSSFSDWYSDTAKRLDHLSKLLSKNDGASDCMDYASRDSYQLESFSRCCGDVVVPSEIGIESMSKLQLRAKFHAAQQQLNSLYSENKLIREMMQHAADYGKMQVMTAEIQMLKADRDRLRASLGKVVKIEDKIQEYKQQASMTGKYEAEVENLRKEVKTLNDKLSTIALDHKNQISTMEMQMKITQKGLNEYRNKAEKLQLQNDLLKSKDVQQSLSPDYLQKDRNLS